MTSDGLGMDAWNWHKNHPNGFNNQGDIMNINYEVNRLINT